RIDANAVRAVAIEQHRRCAIALETFFIDDGDRDFRAVRSLGIYALGLILRRIVSAQHFLLLLELPVARLHIVVEYAGRRDERSVMKAQALRVEFRIRSETGRIDRFGKLDRVSLARGE